MGIFYEKYVSECTKRKKSPSAVALEIGMSKTAVNGWKTGKSNPTDATKLRLSEYFDLPLSYWEDDKKKENPATKRDEVQRAVSNYDLLNDENKAIIDQMIEKLIKSQSGD